MSLPLLGEFSIFPYPHSSFSLLSLCFFWGMKGSSQVSRGGQKISPLFSSNCRALRRTACLEGGTGEVVTQDMQISGGVILASF